MEMRHTRSHVSMFPNNTELISINQTNLTESNLKNTVKGSRETPTIFQILAE